MANNQGYIKAILQEQSIPSTIEELSIADQVNEYIMTSLRTMWGCDLDKINDSWYISLDKRIIEKYIQQQLINQQDQTLFLTQQGKLFADAIAADLFIAL
jgi:oxygen-independent coproporphyrinogen-3 oxidase